MSFDGLFIVSELFTEFVGFVKNYLGLLSLDTHAGSHTLTLMYEVNIKLLLFYKKKKLNIHKKGIKIIEMFVLNFI